MLFLVQYNKNMTVSKIKSFGNLELQVVLEEKVALDLGDPPPPLVQVWRAADKKVRSYAKADKDSHTTFVPVYEGMLNDIRRCGELIR